MSEPFDGYHKWLGIAPDEQPPDHYRLLGIRRFEDDVDVIANAADKQMGHLRTFQSGQRAALSQRILNEISAAKVCLLNREKKAAYDQALMGGGHARQRATPAVAKQAPPRVAVALSNGAVAAVPSGTQPASIVVSTESRAERRAETRRQRTNPAPIVAAIVIGLTLLVGVIFALRSGRPDNTQPAESALANRDTVGAQVHSDQQGPDTAPTRSNNESVSQPREGTDAIEPPIEKPAAPASERNTATTPPPAQVPIPSSNPATVPAQQPTVSPTSIPEDPRPQKIPPDQAAASDARLPVPDQAAQQASLELVKGVFKEEDNNAKTQDEKRALARRLIETGLETKDDPSAVFVLIKYARDTAAAAGDPALVIEAVEELAKRYAIDALEMKDEGLAQAHKSLRPADDHRSFVAEARKVVDEASKAGRFDLALPMSESVLASARKTADIDLIKEIVAANKNLETDADQHRVVERALAVLQANPDDASANLAAGKYRCFVQSDWETGLPMLALCSDAGLKAAATLELAGTAKPQDQVAVGDAWWNLAEKEEGKEVGPLRERAIHWYRQALPELANTLLKSKVEQRLGQHKPPRREAALEVVSTFQVAPVAPLIASLSRDGELLLLVDGSRTSRLYKTANGEPVGHELHEKGGVASGRFTFDGETIVTAPWEGGSTLWNLHTGQSRGGPRVWQSKTLACAPNGTWMGVGQYRGKVSITDMKSNQGIVDIGAFGRGESIEGVAFSQDSKLVAAVTRGGSGKVFELPAGNQLADLGGGLRTALAFTPDGRLLVASQSGGVIQIRSPQTGENLAAWQGHTDVVRSIAAAPDGMVVTASSDHTARVWNADKGSSQTIWSHTAPLAAVGFSNDFGHFAVVSDDGTAQIWKVNR